MGCDLTCVDWTARIVDRATGAPKPIPLPLEAATLTVQRRVCVTSIAELTFQGRAADCCDIAGPLAGQEWCCNLELFRNPQPGTANHPVWDGPIVLLGDRDGAAGPQYTIRAYDRSVWWFGPAAGERIVTDANIAGEQVDTPLSLFLRAHDEAVRQGGDGLTITTNDPGPTYALRTDIQIGRPVRDLIGTACDAGLVWTVIGRNLLVGSRTAPHGGNLRGAEFETGGFGNLSDGTQMVNEVAVFGPDGDYLGVVDADSASCRGLHQRTLEIRAAATDADALNIARAYVDTRAEPRRFAVSDDSTGLGGRTCTIDFDDLVPGREFRALSEPDDCVPVDQDQFLLEVDVTVDSGTETYVGANFGSLPLLGLPSTAITG